MRVCAKASVYRFGFGLLQPLRPCAVFTEKLECSEQRTHMQIAGSNEERDDEERRTIPQVNVPVGILVILILLVLLVIICFQVRLKLLKQYFTTINVFFNDYYNNIITSCYILCIYVIL